jgi:glycosyltransferase involved in cell wall biosynthesis
LKLFAAVNGKIVESLGDNYTPTYTRIHYLLRELKKFDDLEVTFISFHQYRKKNAWTMIANNVVKTVVAFYSALMLARERPMVFFAYPDSLVTVQNRAIFALSKLLNLTIILDVHDTIEQAQAVGAPRSAISERTEEDCIKNASLISSSVKGPLWEHLKEKYSVNDDKVVFVPNAVEDSLLARFPLPYKSVDSRFNICYIGGITKNRGIDLLVEACSELHQVYPHIKLIIFGWYGEGIAKELKDAIEKSSFIIRREVPREQIPSSLHAIDLFVMPYNPNEIYMSSITPTKFFEYIGTGIPTICTKSETLMDLVVSKGILYIDYSVKDFRTAIESMIGQPALREEMSRELMSIRRAHTWGERADRLHGAIIDMLNSTLTGEKD